MMMSDANRINLWTAADSLIPIPVVVADVRRGPTDL